MYEIIKTVLRLKIWSDTRGQDIIEYALVAGFIAATAAAIMPGVASSIDIVFSKVNSNDRSSLKIGLPGGALSAHPRARLSS